MPLITHGSVRIIPRSNGRRKKHHMHLFPNTPPDMMLGV
nr:MAG TPA: hypothetical protein [Caudoviricetes sp.]